MENNFLKFYLFFPGKTLFFKILKKSSLELTKCHGFLGKYVKKCQDFMMKSHFTMPSTTNWLKSQFLCQIKMHVHVQSIDMWNEQTMRELHTLRGRSQTTFTRFVFFWPPTPLRLHFLWYKSLQKVNFFDYLPPSSCKRSLWTPPYDVLYK